MFAQGYGNTYEVDTNRFKCLLFENHDYPWQTDLLQLPGIESTSKTCLFQTFLHWLTIMLKPYEFKYKDDWKQFL